MKFRNPGTLHLQLTLLRTLIEEVMASGVELRAAAVYRHHCLFSSMDADEAQHWLTMIAQYLIYRMHFPLFRQSKSNDGEVPESLESRTRVNHVIIFK